MKKPIQISIPQPCHEKWAEMAPADNGRFCASCQKNVIDFTKMSDRKIANAFKADKNLCGRFFPSQLERDLVIPKEKGTLWAVASAAVISFLSLGSSEALAQESAKTEVSDNLDQTHKQAYSIKGTVKDSLSSLPGCTVLNLTSKESVQANMDGEFVINANKGDSLEISYPTYKTTTIEILNKLPLTITLVEETNLQTVVVDRYTKTLTYTTGAVTTISAETIESHKERTFFGRIFYSIGNWFR